MKRYTVLSNNPTDFERIKKAITDYRLKCVDPDAYHTQCMFDKLKQTKQKQSSRYWDADHECWLPEGTAIKPHPWDKGELDNG